LVAFSQTDFQAGEHDAGRGKSFWTVIRRIFGTLS
jgi:hypothetical protein